MRAKLFRDVPFARAGSQQYLGDEIGRKPGELVTVERPTDEVRRSASSFEGVPVTFDHPPDMLTAEQIDNAAVGMVSDVRFDDTTSQLRGDLILWDEVAIRTVADGRRELSAGYQAQYLDENGVLRQRGITGNHVALVERGRSGSAQRIGG